MSEKRKHIKSYSASDIRNYLEGKLSSAEMHAMEKAAMDDPLLSDAMEGMALKDRRQNISFASDTEELKKRLQGRIKQQEKNRILPFILKWRIAASVLLLAGAGILSYFSLIRKPGTNRNISLVPEKNKIPHTFIQKDLQIPPAKIDTVPQSAPLKTPRNMVDTVSVAFNDKSIPNLSLFNRERATDEKKKSKYEPEEPRLSPVQVAPNPESPSVAAVESKELSTSIPVDKNKADFQPAALAALQGKAAGVIARERGNIDDSLADVVVVGYGARKREVTEEDEIPAAAQKRSIIQKAEPVNGWPAYNAYINKNKKINSADSLLKGDEIVSFLINQKGELSSFKIEKSISPAHDATVIRLIKEGPAWKLLRGKKRRCRLTVAFN